MANGSEKLLPRGIRNNNPGNIKLGTNWDGLSDEQNDDVFCQFKEPVWGIRALMRILLTSCGGFFVNSLSNISGTHL